MPEIQTVRFKDFRGGIADSGYHAQQGTFTDAKNLDIRSKSPIVRPAVGPAAASFTTSTHEMYCAVDGYFFGEGGKVYAYNATDDTPARTITGGATIYSAARFDNKIFFLHEGGSVKLGTYDGTTWTDEVSATGTSIATNTDNNYPMVEFAGKLYIGSGNDLYSVTAALVRTLELENVSGNIVGLTVSGQMLKIFLSDGGILFWDGTEGTSYNERIDLRLPIRTVYGSLTEDFIIAGNSTSGADTHVFRMQGYQYEKLATYLGKNIQLFSENEGNTSQMAYSNGIVAMPGIVEPDSGSPYQGIYTYGSQDATLPPSWNFQYSTSSGGYNYSNISCIHYYKGDLYVGYTDSNGTIGVDKFSQDPESNASKYTNGHLITTVFDGGARNRRKKIQRVRYFGSTASDVTINYNTSRFYLGTFDRRKLLKDSLSGFTELCVFTNTDSAEQNSVYGKVVDIPDFYALQLQVELGANSTLGELQIDFIYLD